MINKGSEVDQLWICDADVYRYFSNHLLMYHLVDDKRRLIIRVWPGELEIWIGWFLALYDLEEQKSH